MTTFADLGVPADLVAVLTERGISSPFPIQAASIPDGLAGRDVAGRAPTGSGKTLAFALPLISMVGKAEPRKPRALILAPTRELAEQIKRELVPLAAVRRRWVATVYGGVGYEPQRRALRKGADVVVACPGRLADLIREGTVDLSRVDMVVVDEADRMADMGFLPEVRRLLDMTAAKRQTWLFSATLDGDIAVLTRDYQTSPVRHEVGGDDDRPSDVRHVFWSIDHADRLGHTADIIGVTGQSIVFCRTRHGADKVAKRLAKTGIRAEAIHGGRSQGQRQRALNAFSKGNTQALVATDVAARGIHVDNVAAVIHYEPTDDAKTYLHRSGRTARAGSDGIVISLVTPHEERGVKAIQRSVGLAPSFVRPSPNTLGTAGERVGILVHTASPGSNGNGSRNGSRNAGRKRQGHGGRRGQQGRHRSTSRRS
jgi:superfamily II DNA/RNA helicase